MFVQLQKEFLGRKPGERIDVSESDANALIAQQLATPVTDDLITPAVQRAMEQAFSGFQKGLDAVINAALKQFADAQHKSRKNAVPAIFGNDGEGDPHGKTFGDWLVNVAVATTGKGDRGAAVKRLNDVYASDFRPWQKAAMGESSGTTGGYVVPPDFYQQLLAISAEANLFRQLAFVQPMASATLQFPYLDITTVQSAGNSPFFGGVIASWTSEAQTRTETPLLWHGLPTVPPALTEGLHEAVAGRLGGDLRSAERHGRETVPQRWRRPAPRPSRPSR
jgi:HK97 family phage major capsid protein